MELYNPANDYRIAKCIRPSRIEELAPLVRELNRSKNNVPLCNTGHGFHVSSKVAQRVLDLSELRETHQISRELIQISAGTRWRDVSPIVPEGKRLVTGSFDGVGACGYLSGSGVGPDFRFTGPSSNYVESLEVIDKRGTLVRCNREVNPEIFEIALSTKGAEYVIQSATLRIVDDHTFYCARVSFDADKGECSNLLKFLHRWLDHCSAYQNIASSVQVIATDGIASLNFRAMTPKECSAELQSMMCLLDAPVEYFDLQGSQLSKLHSEPEKSPGTFMDGFGITTDVTLRDVKGLINAALSIGSQSPFFGFEIRHCDVASHHLDESLPSKIWKNVGFIFQHGSLSAHEINANPELIDVLGASNTRLLPNFSRELDNPVNMLRFMHEMRAN